MPALLLFRLLELVGSGALLCWLLLLVCLFVVCGAGWLLVEERPTPCFFMLSSSLDIIVLDDRKLARAEMPMVPVLPLVHSGSML